MENLWFSEVGSAGEGSEGSIDPLFTSATIEDVLPTAMKEVPDVFTSGGLENMSEIAQTTQDIITSVEPSLSSLGLCAYTPVGFVQSFLEVLHVNMGLPWWGAIAACTIVFRTLMLPLILKGQRNTARLNKIKPELERIQGEMRELANTQDTMRKSMAAMELQKLLRENDCHPLKVLIIENYLFEFSSQHSDAAFLLSVFLRVFICVDQ